jgi:gliding motility-associated-like protein
MKQLFYFLAFSLIFFTSARAQAPANDVCSGAQVVTPNGSCNPGTTVGSADNWLGSVGCAGNNPEVWYSFTATGSQLAFTVTPGTMGGNVEFILVQATTPCNGLTIVGSQCGAGPLTGTINGLQSGSLYYYTISSTGATGTFTSCVNNTTPPPVAGQDCATAATLCTSATFSQSTSAAGFGTQEVSTLNSCWGSGGERQSKWFKFTVGCSGTLEFNINPVTNSNDYDWALWNVTSAGCPTSANALQSAIACNWSACKGSTGLSSCPSSEPGVNTGGAGCFGGPAAYGAPINVTAGQTYALLVDNFSTSNSGFSLIFGGACNGGTALIGPSAAFTFTSPSCGAYNFTKSCQTTNSTFLWSFGDGATSTLQNPSHTYTTSGTFIVSLQVTDALGCTIQTSQTIVVGIPTSNAGADQVLCSTATGTIGAATTAGYTYSWSPSTGLSSTTISNPSFTLTNTGASAATTVYTVTTTSSGCTSTDAVSITVNPSPTVSAGPTQSLNCINTSTVLSGTSSGGSITWSGPGVTGGGTTTTPTVNAAGVYTMSVLNAGCTSTSTVTVGQNTVAPTVTATTSNSLNCTVTSASVIASTTASPATYTWTGTGITAGAGTATAAVNAGGTFNYTVTSSANGCKTTGAVIVNQNTTVPTATAGTTGSITCTTNTISLIAGAGGLSYTWTAPAGSSIPGGANNQNTTGQGAGTYTVLVMNAANNCTNSATVAANIDQVIPTATAGTTGSVTCGNTTINLTSGASGLSYTWTAPAGSSITGGVNNQNTTAQGAGTYTIKVLNSVNGCTNTAAVAANVDMVAPTASASTTGSINCTTSTVQTIVSSTTTPVTYAWSGPGVVSVTNGTATVNAGGTYNYTVLNTVNQCSVTGSVSITQSANIPSVIATANGSLNCQVTSTTVAASTTASPVTYTWNGPGITGSSNNSSATVNLGGNYIYTVTNTSNSCTATGTVTVIQNTTAPSPVATTNGTITCNTTTATINGGPAGMTYTWTAPAGSSVSSANQATTTATGGGTYSLSIVDPANSCGSSTTLIVPTQTNSPTASIINSPTLTCTNTLVTINGGPASGVTYTWSGPGISGSANNAAVNASVTGTYSLSVTSTSNFCTSAPVTVSVSQNNATPTITAVSQTGSLVCGVNATVALSGISTPAGSTYTWTSSSPSFFVGSVNNPTVAVNSATTYTLLSTHPVSGCISSLVYTVVPDINSPTVTLSANTDTITCLNTAVSTTATSNPSTVSYTWTGPGIVGSSTLAAVTGSLSGTYNLTVTNTNNSCTTVKSFVVSADNTPLTVTAAASNSIDCINNTSILNTTVSPLPGPFSYSWTTGATTSSASVSPTITTNYVVTVTNTANGCTGSQTVGVIVDTTPPTGVSVSPNDFTLTCLNSSTVLTGTTTSGGAVTYSWASSAGGFTDPGTSTVNVSVAGTYSLIITGTNGCSASAVATISPNSSAPIFTVSNASPSITCASNPTVSITVTSSVAISSYSWSGPGIAGTNTLTSATFTAAGNYTIDVTDINSCKSTSVISVGSATNPPVLTAGTDTAQPITCTNTITLLYPQFTPAADLTYTWTGTGVNGAATGSVQASQTGTYSVLVTNSVTGCSASATIVVSGSAVNPTITVSSSSSLGISCQPGTSTVNLSAQSNPSSVTYTWNTGATTSTIDVSTAGVYTISVTEINSGCIATTTIDVPNNVNTPSINVTSAGNLPCGGGTTSLSALSSNSNLSYSWTGSGVVNGSATANAVINLPGNYTVTAIDALTGCSGNGTIAISQSSVSALAVADATTGAAPLSVNFTDQSTGATTYTWSFGNGASSQSQNTSNTYASSGNYTVVLTVSNGACVASDTLLIKVLEALGEIPEIFTPNNDGSNDVFKIDGLESYPGNSLQVFNRWGNPVYNAKPYTNNWDGAPNAAGKTGSGKLPVGTYYYILELGDANNTVFKGYVQVEY